MSYTPTTWSNSDIITAEKLNKIENGIVSGGLPSVTSTDNGDVLTVVNGAWAKAAPSGGGGALIVHMSSEDIGSATRYTLDKTAREIIAALPSVYVEETMVIPLGTMHVYNFIGISGEGEFAPAYFETPEGYVFNAYISDLDNYESFSAATLDDYPRFDSGE